MPKALSSFRICDFTGQSAGAGATRWLASFGAEVIRIEDPVREGRWDILRGTGPYIDERRGVDFGGAFNNHNTNKYGITLNLRTDRGKEILTELVRRSDVVSENFAKGVLEKWGFGYERLKAIKPDIVYVSNSGFGHVGPCSDFKTWGPVVQAVSGLTFTSGLPDREPAGWGYSFMDHTGAYYMAIAILMGLIHRQRTGEGQWIDLACTESALALHGPALLDWTVNGRPARREGQPHSNRNRWPPMAPHGIYPCRGDDEWVAIACRHEDDWEALAAVIGAHWCADAVFGDLDSRLVAQDLLDERVSAWTAPRGKFEVEELLRAAGVPAAPVLKTRGAYRSRCEHRAVRPLAGSTPLEDGGCAGRRSAGALFGYGLAPGTGCALPRRAQLRGTDRSPRDDGGRGAATAGGGSDLSALEGLRVVELAREPIAYAGKLLADMGADVILVEPPGGDPSRNHPPFLDDEPGEDRSLYWWHFHTSKRGIVLDLDDPRDGRRFRRLLGTADILLEAEPRTRLAELALDYEDLAPDCPGLIHIAVTPYGRNDPKSDLPFTDLTVMAAAGPPWSCGYDDRSLPPIRSPGQGYQTAAHFAVLSALTAVLHRATGGEGQFIDLSMNAASNVTTEAATYTWLVARETVQRQTGRHAAVQPTANSQQRCADGRYVNTGVPPRFPVEFARLLNWLRKLGLEDELPEAVFLEMGANWEGPFDLSKLGSDDTIDAVFGAGREALRLIAQRIPAKEFFLGEQRAGLTVGVIHSPEEAFEDEHFKARGFQVPVHHDDLDRTFVYPGAPYRFTASPWRISRRAPRLGEHNGEVLGELEKRG